MRRRVPVLTRTWAALATVLLVPLGAVTAVPAAATAAPARLPHVAGGYVGSGARVPAKVVRTGQYGSRSLPESVDLRSSAPPVGDQGQVGACVAWTIAYDIMGYYAKRNGGVGAPYAPMFLYLRNVVPGGAPTAGLYPDSVLANAQAAGVDTQADYWQGTTNWQTPPTAAQIANATNYRLTGWNRLFLGGNQGAPAQTVIQQALAAGNPVALSFPVYRDFMYLRGTSVYNTLSGTSLGGHMVAAFGYDAQGVWLRNSWGTGWGDRGDVKVSWAFVTTVVNSAYTVAGIRTPATPAPAAAPALTGLSVNRGLGGATVTISGTGLIGATSVRFGTDGATFTTTGAGAATKLVATAPADAAGVVDVTVTTPAGTSTVVPAGRFTYLPPAPVVTSLTPAVGPTNMVTPVVLTGANLATATRVMVGGVSVAYTRLSDTSLRLAMSPRAAGLVAVQVVGPGGISAVTAAGSFTYQPPPAPVITGLSATTGRANAANPLILTGAHLAGATRVMIGGVSVAFSRVSATELRFTAPPRGAGPALITVTTAGGISAPATYTYVAPTAARQATA